MNFKKHFKSMTVAMASFVLICSNFSMPAAAYKNTASGTENDITVYGTGCTVVCFNCNGSFYTCNVSVNDFGSGKGDLYADCYCGVTSYKKTFYGTGTKTMMYRTSSLQGYWSVDFQNSKPAKKRTGVDVGWNFG